MSFSLFFWNIHSIRANGFDINDFLRTYQPDSFLLNETWLKPQDNIKTKSYITYSASRVDGYGGLLSGHKNIWKSELVPELSYNSNDPTDLEISTTKIVDKKEPNRTIYFINVYATPKYKGDFQPLITILQDLETEKVILAGDLNSHHPTWGYPYSDRKGRALIDIFNDHDMFVVNSLNPTPTRITRPNQDPSFTDLIVIKNSLAASSNLTVLDIPSGSDHHPLIFTFNPNLTPICSDIPPNNPTPPLINWKKFAKIVEQQFKIIENVRQKDYDVWNAVIQFALENSKFSPKENSSPPSHQLSKHERWWSVECQKAKNLRAQCLNNFKTTNSYEDLIAYRISCNKFKLTVRKAKRDSWHKYCSTINRNTPTSEIWAKLKTQRLSKEPVRSKDDSWVKDFQAKFSPDYVESEPLHMDVLDEDPIFFSYDYFEQTLLTMSKKTPGKDRITAKLLKVLPPIAKVYLYKVFLKTMNLGTTPAKWNEVIIKPIKKPGKPENIHTSYRPIALLSIVRKAYEKILRGFIEEHVEHHNLLSPVQFGFRKHFSLFDNHNVLNQEILEALNRNEVLKVVFLDIQGAYDSVHIPTLVKMMKHLRINKRLIKSVYWLFGRKSVYIQLYKVEYGVRISFVGLAQGSVLSPLLYTYHIHLQNSQSNYLQQDVGICR